MTEHEALRQAPMCCIKALHLIGCAAPAPLSIHRHGRAVACALKASRGQTRDGPPTIVQGGVMTTLRRMELGLYDAKGQLNIDDCGANALLTAPEAPREARTLCGLLVHTGCRLSEARASPPIGWTFEQIPWVFETLKKRRSGVYRAVPVPHTLVNTLDLVHGLRPLQGRTDRGPQPPAVAVEPDDRLAAGVRGHGAGRSARPTSESEGLTLWLWRGGGDGRRPAQSGAEVVRACAALHDRHLCGCGGRGGTCHRGADVAQSGTAPYRATRTVRIRDAHAGACPTWALLGPVKARARVRTYTLASCTVGCRRAVWKGIGHRSSVELLREPLKSRPFPSLRPWQRHHAHIDLARPDFPCYRAR